MKVGEGNKQTRSYTFSPMHLVFSKPASLSSGPLHLL